MTSTPTNIPTEFPSGSPLAQAQITPTQVKTVITDLEEARAAMREKYGDALAAESIEGRALTALDKAFDLIKTIAPML